MKRFLFLLFALWLPGVLGAASSLGNARRAQALLGPEIWSCVVRVENTAARSAYPAVVHALVFEEAGLLWFYTDFDGTQSLTLHPDRLAEEKADFAPLLRAIDPGFVTYAILPDEATDPPVAWRAALPNGCFVESLAALQQHVRRGERIESARLLNCYVDTPAGEHGHTVLTYETPRGLFLLDPGRSPEPQPMPRAWANDALALAGAALQGSRVTRARWVPTALPRPPVTLASFDFPHDPVPDTAPRLMR